MWRVVCPAGFTETLSISFDKSYRSSFAFLFAVFPLLRFSGIPPPRSPTHPSLVGGLNEERTAVARVSFA